MKKIFLTLCGLVMAALTAHAQDINIANISRPVDVDGLGSNAVLMVNAPIDDLTVTCLSGHPIEVFNLGQDDKGLYQYKVLIDLSDEEQLTIRRRLSFSQRGKINAVATEPKRYTRGQQTTMDIVVIRQPLRVEQTTTAMSMIPEAEKSCIELLYEKDDLTIGMLAPNFVPTTADIASLPAKDEQGTPISYRRYELKSEKQPNETFKYSLIIDLGPYVRELRPAYEQALEAGDLEKADRIAAEASSLLRPGFWVSTNETNRSNVEVDSLMPRGKRIYQILALQSEYLNYLNNAERCYNDGDYFRAYKYYGMARQASDVPSDPQTTDMLTVNMNRSAKIHNTLRQARAYFNAGERVRLNQQVLTSEVDSARLYYRGCEMKCNDILLLNPRDEYSRSSLDRIRQIRTNHLKRIIYGTVVDNMRQHVRIDGVSIYGVTRYNASKPEDAIAPENLLGQTDGEGAFRIEVTDGIVGMVFVHETNKDYKTPTVEQIPADVHRKLMIKMRPRNLNM